MVPDRRGDRPCLSGASIDVWQQVLLPFESFQATSLEQLFSDTPRLNAREVRSIGLTAAASPRSAEEEDRKKPR